MIALTLLMTSCIFDKLKKDPEPQLAGLYTISTYQVTVGSQKVAGSSGTVQVTGPTDNRIDFTVTLPGIDPADFDDVEIRKNGKKDYDIYDGSTKVGSLNGTDFNLNLQGPDSNGQYIQFSITAKK